MQNDEPGLAAICFTIKRVLCEVGGWLSHMAIVTREHNIPMLVGCSGLDGLENGMEMKALKSGKMS
ncbi:MAG: hypothetical protein JKX71_09340 [Amylibacter sp.]|nr:hypothetical protein [Amylibacter sp.]